MSYAEALEAEVTHKEALAELARHHADVDEFYEACGKRDFYVGKDVLDFLNY